MIDAFAGTAQGRRRAMEDRHVLSVAGDEVTAAVFDGHGGAAVAVLAAARFAGLVEAGTPGSALLRIHEESRGLEGGACAAAFRLRGAELEVASAGDCGLVLVPPAGEVRPLTPSHRLDDPAELRRVVAAGAAIEWPYVVDPRTGAGLMPTRSLGDHDFSRLGVLATPFESRTEYSGGWLIMACDGLWDVVEPAEVRRVIAGHDAARGVAEALVREALEVRRGTDNITVLAVRRTA